MRVASVERLKKRLRGIEDDPRFVAEELKLAFAEELAKMLEARGLKRTELAERLNTHRGYVTRVLNTDYNLTIETMARFALALDARVELRILPRETTGRKPGARVPARAPRRSETKREFTAADKPARAKSGRPKRARRQTVDSATRLPDRPGQAGQDTDHRKQG